MDGLSFLPLYFIYHDGWYWKESKDLLTHNPNGDVVTIDGTKKFYQRGHCHLFLPTYNMKNKGQTLAYSGEQKYNFEINDEWGPNSTDVNQTKAIKLLGKPIWYFYVEEYWRRMYIQPYDQIDEECDLPLNQSIEYETYTFRKWMSMEIEKVHSSKHFTDVNSYGGVDWYYNNYYDSLRFNHYLPIRRRHIAFMLWIPNNVNEDLWKQMFGKSFDINKCTFREIVNYIQPQLFYNSKFTHDFSENFNSFYKINAQKYNGYLSEEEAMRNFLTLHNVNLNQHKKDKDGNVIIPKEKTIGHIGIKYDASKACHSLGPFREGGEFYFFNTVVNRTMPCEYWLDERKKVRQYYLKQKENEDDNNTTGQGIWIFAGDNSHFVWVIDKFAEAKKIIDSWELGEKEYNKDEYTISHKTHYNHRKRNINGIEQQTEWSYGGSHHSYWKYKYTFQNAKRIKTDKYFYYEDKNNSNNNRWYGTNEQVVHDDLISYNYQEIEHSGEIDKEIQGSYNESGWHEILSSSTSAQSKTETPLTIYWSEERWQGWYEYGEIIKCAYNNKWYKRNWKPILYEKNDPYEKQTINNAPHWHFKKRQAFPNPPPWLCDDPNKKEDDNSSEEQSSNSSFDSSSSQDNIHFAIKPDIYENEQDNRIHLLHWQYCHYYNLIRYSSVGLHNNNTAIMALKEILYIYVINNGTIKYIVTTYEKRNEEIKYYENLDSMKDKQFTKTIIPLTWETAIDLYMEENGQITSIEEETVLFNQFISNLFSYDINAKIYPFGDYNDKRLNRYSPLYYLDQYKYYYKNENNDYIQIEKKYIDIDKNIYYDNNKAKPLPSPTYIINESSYIDVVNSDEQKEYLTHITFEEFKKIWVPLTQQEITELKLEGDMPQRNDTPYPTPTYEQAYGSSSSQNLIDGQMEHRLNLLKELKQDSLNESMTSFLYSDFFPRYDDKTRAINAMRAELEPPLPPFKLSILEETDKIPEYDIIDSYRNGKINPIENWKKYFNKREIYTIPNSNLVKGDYKITNDLSTPNNPNVHPRERSYSNEDGARRYYPDDKYISPIIEYQKIIRLNWERLPQKKDDELYLQKHWRNDTICNWGDGFNTSITIPFQINKEIQSPFSDGSKITKPIGEYCHNCVKEENKMRYHIEWYDSLEQIRKYDFPNYVNIINEFQLQYLPAEVEENSDEYIQKKDENGEELETEINVSYLYSLYKQDFNNYQKTLDLRKQTYKNPETGIEKTWEELLNKYWKKIDEQNNFSNTPIVRNRDCYGKETKENSFVTLKSGKKIWRAPTTYFLPTIDKVATIDNGNGNITYGYIDSNGEVRKGGKVVEWNDPYNKNDGMWVEQCLGAVVKVKCVQILQDGLGYRWQQEIQDTALVSKNKITGMDYE